METLIERFVSSNARCYACGGLVYAVEQKKTANHIYHNRCFRCRICKRNLTGSSLNEEGDEIYCTNCYRKKQRGDCDSLDFKRAAEERAQYVHNNRHPDQSPPAINPQPPVRRDFSRYPSLALRQLERRFLSHQEPNTKDFEKSNDNYHRLISGSHPHTINTSFSAPGYLTNVERRSSLTLDQRSPPLQFLPVFSPSPSVYSGSTPTIPKTPLLFRGAKFDNSANGIQSRSNRNSLNSTNGKTPPIEQKHSTLINTNHKYENKDNKESTFLFPDKIITPIRRRSSSINYVLNSRKNK